MELFSDEVRRDPHGLYDRLRGVSSVVHEPDSGLWMLLDHQSVKQAMSDHGTFSSLLGPAEWMIFMDPPRHSKLRALVSQAFTPRSIANLEGRIGELSRGLLDRHVGRGEMDLAEEFSIPLPMMVISELLGVPATDLWRFRGWNDVMLNMSHTIGRQDDEAVRASAEFAEATAQMSAYLSGLVAERRATPRDDLLTRLVAAEVDGERLAHEQILGFFQLLLLAGSETTTNLINNAILCFLEHPDQLARLREEPGLLVSSIEEVLRFRSPLQWMIRLVTREISLHGRTIPAGSVVLAVMGAANRDPARFRDPHRFDITRDPNPHLAFGHGIHSCLGAALARMEARIALGQFLGRVSDFRLASDAPWEPRKGHHVHGPSRLPIRFTPVT